MVETSLRERSESSGNASASFPLFCRGGKWLISTRVGCKISIVDLLVANMRAIGLFRFRGNRHDNMEKNKVEHPLRKDG